MLRFFSEIKKTYGYRDAIWHIGITDLKLKYASSFFGFFWSILEPLLIILVYSLVFPLILKAELVNWVLFFICGLIPFRFLRRGTAGITTSMVDYRDILTKVDIMPEVLPFAKALSESISFLLEYLVLVFIVTFFVKPTIYLLLFPVLLLTELFLILGMGLFLACSYPKYRDIAYILNVGFEALFFLTPIVYRLTLIPKEYHTIYLLNPFARLFYLWQGIMLSSLEAFIHYLPIIRNTVMLFIFSGVIFFVGYWRFNKLKYKVVSEL